MNACLFFGGSGCLTPPSRSEAPKNNFAYFPLEVNQYWVFEKKNVLNNQALKLIYGISQQENNIYQMLIETETGQKEVASIHLRNEKLFLVRGTDTGREEAQFLEKNIIPGKTWPWSTGSATVLTEEQVTVPAGTFQTLPVEYKRTVEVKEKTLQVTEKIYFAKEVGWVLIEQKIDGQLLAKSELQKYGLRPENKEVPK